ncbi:MAG: hypothetical protein MJZ37_08965 [Bacilli bacterium]|nr:hypothetical protein [Bacilli bacterium]
MNCRTCKYKSQTALMGNHIDVFCDYKAIEIHPSFASKFIASVKRKDIQYFFYEARTPIWCPLKRRK